MADFKAGIEQLLELSLAPSTTMDAVQSALQVAGKGIGQATVQELDRALEQLAERLIDPNVHRLIAGKMAIMMGGIVEQGGTPEVGAGNLLGLLSETLEQANRITQQVLDLADSQGIGIHDENENLIDPNPLIRHFMPTIMQRAPAEGAALMALNDISIGTIAHLARSKAVRQAAAENPDLLLHRSQMFDQLFQSGQRSFLTQLLLILDQHHLLVLNMDPLTGFRIKISGLLTNFQLQFHLMRILAEPLGQKPWLSEAVIEFELNQLVSQASPIVIGAYQMWNASALDGQAKLPEPMQNDYWIWNEGVPADIEMFEGERVVLLGSPAYERSWPAGLVIAGLVPEMEVTETLDAAEVSRWLKRLAAES